MRSMSSRELLLGSSAVCAAMAAPAIGRGEPQYRLKFANIKPAIRFMIFRNSPGVPKLPCNALIGQVPCATALVSDWLSAGR